MCVPCTPRSDSGLYGLLRYTTTLDVTTRWDGRCRSIGFDWVAPREQHYMQNARLEHSNKQRNRDGVSKNVVLYIKNQKLDMDKSAAMNNLLATYS